MVAFVLEEVDFDDPTMNMQGCRALAIAKPTPRVSNSDFVANTNVQGNNQRRKGKPPLAEWRIRYESGALVKPTLPKAREAREASYAPMEGLLYYARVQKLRSLPV